MMLERVEALNWIPRSARLLRAQFEDTGARKACKFGLELAQRTGAGRRAG
jgi:hypothetical protein